MLGRTPDGGKVSDWILLGKETEESRLLWLGVVFFLLPSPQHRRQGLLSRKSESGPTRGGSGGALIDALID
jgi:hypothetical protein